MELYGGLAGCLDDGVLYSAVRFLVDVRESSVFRPEVFTSLSELDIKLALCMLPKKKLCEILRFAAIIDLKDSMLAEEWFLYEIGLLGNAREEVSWPTSRLTDARRRIMAETRFPDSDLSHLIRGFNERSGGRDSLPPCVVRLRRQPAEHRCPRNPPLKLSSKSRQDFELHGMSNEKQLSRLRGSMSKLQRRVFQGGFVPCDKLL